MSGPPSAITPIEYLRRVRVAVERREGGPMTWAHVVLSSLDSARRFSQYGSQPRLCALRDELAERVLERIVRTDPTLSSPNDAELSQAVHEMESYERERPRPAFMQERFLRWLSDRPDPGVWDWTLGEWHRLVREHGLGPGHFDGTREWAHDGQHPQRAETERDWRRELTEMVGLSEVKRYVRELGEFLDIERRRQQKGHGRNAFALHQVFVGNPGTGKTTVARILAGIYHEYAFLRKGQLVQADRAGLVAPYVGQTEERTTKTINEAIGGVLFIDEAYSLAGEGGNDFGPRAIDTLVKRMSDERHEFVVIVAGYPEEMERFIQSNPGLRSRFTSWIEFPDYADEELARIFEMQAERAGFTIDQPTVTAARAHLHHLRHERGREFGNARDARTLWEATLRRQGARLCASERQGKDIESELLNVVAVDVPEHSGGPRR